MLGVGIALRSYRRWQGHCPSYIQVRGPARGGIHREKSSSLKRCAKGADTLPPGSSTHSIEHASRSQSNDILRTRLDKLISLSKRLLSWLQRAGVGARGLSALSTALFWIAAGRNAPSARCNSFVVVHDCTAQRAGELITFRGVLLCHPWDGRVSPVQY